MTNLPLCLVHRLSESCQEAKEFLLKHTIGGYVAQKHYLRREDLLKREARVEQLLKEGLDSEAIRARTGMPSSTISKIRNRIGMGRGNGPKKRE